MMMAHFILLYVTGKNFQITSILFAQSSNLPGSHQQKQFNSLSTLFTDLPFAIEIHVYCFK